MERLTTPSRLVEFLGAQVLSTLGELLRPGAPVALIDFPGHYNVGDAAIWLGERAALRRLRVPVNYSCDHRGYHPNHLRRAIPDGTILLHGGGNFGDLYPVHQNLRERVLKDFPDRRIIQLPQTITFRDWEARDRVIARVRRHEHFTLLARDVPSLEAHGRDLAEDVRLCADSAFCLGAVEGNEGAGVLWLLREDKERTVSRRPPFDGARVTDWPPPSYVGVLRRRVCQVLCATGACTGAAGIGATAASGALFDRLAAERFRVGTNLVRSARAVVTDRLHGCILALLAGRQVIAMDNATGKLRAFYETWAGPSKSIQWAADVDEASELASRLTATAAAAA